MVDVSTWARVPSHGANRGSNPRGDANLNNTLAGTAPPFGQFLANEPACSYKKGAGARPGRASAQIPPGTPARPRTTDREQHGRQRTLALKNPGGCVA